MNLLIMHSSPVTPSPFTPTPKTAKNTVVCFSLSRSSQRICACKRLSVTFRNTMILYGLRCLINPSPICHVAGPLLSGCPPLRTLRSLPATYFPHFFFYYDLSKVIFNYKFIKLCPLITKKRKHCVTTNCYQ